MTALPTTVFLRRHALPAHFLARLDGEGATSRPCLTAVWQLGEDGRPVCRWTLDRRPLPAAGEGGR